MPEDDFPSNFPVEEFDASQMFDSEDEIQEPEYAAEGLYHVALQQVDASGKNAPGAVFLTFEILAGNVANQEGKELRFPIWPPHPNAKDPDRALKRWYKSVLRLMLALGLRKEGERPKFTMTEEWWNSIEGRQCMVRVTHQRKKQTTEGGVEKEWINAVIAGLDDFFPIGSQDASDVPVDANALVAGGYATQQQEI